MVRNTVIGLAGLALGLAAAALVLLPSPSRRVKPVRLDCQIGPTTPGVDVSYYQETIDWQRVHRAGIRFAFIRLSDGATQRDARFATNWDEARRAGLVRGAYQFFRPDQSIAAQADLMIAAMHDRQRDDLPPVIDLEVDGGLAAPVVAARARAWVDRVRDGLGVEPIVYTGGDLWRSGGAELLAAQPLWVAHYTQGCPTLPSPWTRWTFWQHTDRGAVPGIDGAVDLDQFAGTLGELHAER
ncbi:MAG TPA: GH25 family lysozyme [Kofleriaceae bacterium]|nr:GH25 family lysozyme [Kofleriaceae bacterium]